MACGRTRSLAAIALLTLLASPLAAEPGFLQPAPLVPVVTEWPLGPYWQPAKIGERDFYLAEQGNYLRMVPERIVPMAQTGLLPDMIPGHWRLHGFDPAEYAKLAPSWQGVVDSYLDNQWPISTIHYCVAKGNPPPSAAAVARLGNLWLGDSMPEAPIYRLEPLFHYIKTGKKWVGSSMGYVDDEAFVAFMRDRVMPRLDKEMPFCRDPKHQWTRPELRRLCDIYCEEFFNAVPNNRPIAWGMFLSPYHIVDMPNVTTVAEKAADAFRNAHARGLMRQSGGNKIYYTWRGHEPTERYMYPKRGWYSINREEWGYPLPHLWYYIFRPYLIGANYAVTEGFPGSLMQDIEGDGQHELSTLGHIAKRMIDFTHRHPVRGTPYAAVGLLLDYNRDRPTCYSTGGTTYSSVRLPYDDGDHMNHGLIYDLIFPEHRHTRFSGNYSQTAPYGEIFDLLSPNKPGKPIDPKIFAGYRVLLGLGGLRIDAAFAPVLKDFVEQGGTLVLNVADLTEALPLEFFGVRSDGAPILASSATNVQTDRAFAEAPFSLRPLGLIDAETLYTSDDRPLVTRRRIGKGYAILVAAAHMVQSDAIDSMDGMSDRVWRKKPILTFVDDFIEGLTAGLAPFYIRRRAGDKPDLSWQINRKGEGWTVTMYNYSLRREELIARPVGTAKVLAEYPYRDVPFEIVCRAPMMDVVELYEDRDVKWERRDGQMVVTESMRSGEIRVYEFQPRPIKLPPREVQENLALNRPVEASSTLKSYSPQAAVDGVRNNDDWWQSDLDPKRHYLFELPQWLRVDLEETRTIDHVFVQFHTWAHASLHTRQFIYQYVVEASVDGDVWTAVLDESRNMDPARPEGLERWFKPVQARYVRLTVTGNTAKAGVQLVELEVRGPEKTTIQPARKSITPPWHVQFPPELEDAPADRIAYLRKLQPTSVKPGWLPPGKKWAEMNGWVRLYADRSGKGSALKHSLYGESVSEITYAIPPGTSWFAATVGFGNTKRDASVDFRVFVDGEKRFDSGLYRFGRRLLPVVVDVRDRKELKLVVTDGGDSIRNDYAWWGDARFVSAAAE
ncbi:MAG: hypothetical protein HN849_34990, partial [Victivallales bacterium]|nr:hypothetical protein [Victivallales bacterium]